MRKIKRLSLIAVLAAACGWLPFAAAEEAAAQDPAAKGSSAWEVNVSPQGDVLLKPKAPEAAGGEANPAKVAISEESRRRLESQGWRIAELDDGSFELYPPLSAEPEGLLDDILSCSMTSDEKTKMPVGDWKAALTLANQWLKQAGKGEELKIGKIQQVNRVFMVSVVRKASPHLLKHQLAIRMQDGRLVALY